MHVHVMNYDKTARSCPQRRGRRRRRPTFYWKAEVVLLLSRAIRHEGWQLSRPMLAAAPRYRPASKCRAWIPFVADARYSTDCRLTALSPRQNDCTNTTSSFARNDGKRGTTKASGRKKRQTAASVADSLSLATWRIFGLEVHPNDMPAMYFSATKNQTLEQPYLHDGLLRALYQRLKLDNKASSSPPTCIGNVRVVRCSLDARQQRHHDGPRFVYVVDVDVAGSGGGRRRLAPTLRLRHQPGRMELLSSSAVNGQGAKNATTRARMNDNVNVPRRRRHHHPKVVIVGAGPAGLFCALELARHGWQPLLLERGQPVESRGHDIGALMHRRQLDANSNFCFGEGGAGTWSDGKLTTGIGRNAPDVRHVLATLVAYGAPGHILYEGAPHLGTDNLVRLLRNMRHDLRRLGGTVQFGTKMTGLVVRDGAVTGVQFEQSLTSRERIRAGQTLDAGGSALANVTGTLNCDAVVLATGHSARDVYECLHAAGVQLEPKGFAVGFRVEHPQSVINRIQYGLQWGRAVVTGKAPTDQKNVAYFESLAKGLKVADPLGRVPVPSYRLATDKAFDGERNRGAYSFCMCPGGQIVPTSTDASEVCVNGMSFSRRDSPWANSALVVTVAPDDAILAPYQHHGALAGVAFQRDMEQRAARLGGRNLTVPVQRVTDFVHNRTSTGPPPLSSYRLGVTWAACHELYPAPITRALQHALTHAMERQMPGFVCDDAILHAVETRTSSPVRVARDATTGRARGAVANLYPAGEGAGFAGGIVSAAVDGMNVAKAMLHNAEQQAEGQVTTADDSFRMGNNHDTHY